MQFFGELAADVRYAMRSCGSSPGFTAAATTAVAVGFQYLRCGVVVRRQSPEPYLCRTRWASGRDPLACVLLLWQVVLHELEYL